jgi:LemA protein
MADAMSGELPTVALGFAALPAPLFLWLWWNRTRFARLMKDVPTTTVNGVFVGTVETSGTVVHDQAPSGGLSGIPCVHHAWTVHEHWRRTETYRDSQGKTRTRTRHGSDLVDSGGATVDFLLRDPTGTIVVRSRGADWTTVTTFSRQARRGDPLYASKAPNATVRGSTGVRSFSESGVPVGRTAWVMGNARPSAEGDRLEIGAGGEDGVFMVSLAGEASHAFGARALAAVGLFLGAACAALGGMGLSMAVAGLLPARTEEGVVVAVAASAGVAAWIAVTGLMWAVIVRNGAVRVRNRWERAASLVDVQLKRRADLVPNLVAVTRASAVHESAAQSAVARLRAGASSRDELRMLAERYPALTADAAFLSLQRQLAETESLIAQSRHFEIESRKALLERLTTFPEGLIARLMGVHRPPPALDAPAPPPSSPGRPPRG